MEGWKSPLTTDQGLGRTHDVSCVSAAQNIARREDGRGRRRKRSDNRVHDTDVDRRKVEDFTMGEESRRQ